MKDDKCFKQSKPQALSMSHNRLEAESPKSENITDPPTHPLTAIALYLPIEK